MRSRAHRRSGLGSLTWQGAPRLERQGLNVSGPVPVRVPKRSVAMANTTKATQATNTGVSSVATTMPVIGHAPTGSGAVGPLDLAQANAGEDEPGKWRSGQRRVVVAGAADVELASLVPDVGGQRVADHAGVEVAATSIRSRPMATQFRAPGRLPAWPTAAWRSPRKITGRDRTTDPCRSPTAPLTIVVVAGSGPPHARSATKRW